MIARRGRRTYDEKTDDGDEGHDNLASLAESELVDDNERLRGSQSKEGVDIGRTEEEEDQQRLWRGIVSYTEARLGSEGVGDAEEGEEGEEGGRKKGSDGRVKWNEAHESDHGRDGGAPEDSSGRGEASVLRLFGDVTRRVESGEDARRGEESEHPIPDVRRTRPIVCRSEDERCSLKAVGLRDANGQPDDGQDQVDEDDGGRGFEDERKSVRCRVASVNLGAWTRDVTHEASSL